MWYTQIEEKNDAFKLSGIALDNQTVADFMNRLEKSDRFDNVVLASIKKHTIAESDLSLKQFDVNFQKKKQTVQEPQVKKPQVKNR